jgi:DNA polymerase-3 subunit epsilon
MELKLNKPICFDLETTGIDVGKDRIVEISIFKVFQTETKVKRG